VTGQGGGRGEASGVDMGAWGGWSVTGRVTFRGFYALPSMLGSILLSLLLLFTGANWGLWVS
jgi:hypothetical protein